MRASLIKPLQSGAALKRDIASANTGSADHAIDVWWLGQSGFLIRWKSINILLDPYLSDALTKKYDGTAKPHVRMSEMVIEPEMLDTVDIVTSSHNHTDHLDAETLGPILRINKGIAFVIPDANRDFVARRVGCEPGFPIGLNDGQSVEVKGVLIHGVPAAHNEIERDAEGRCRFMGYVLNVGKYTIYHSGDTLWYDGIVECLRSFQIDIAMLPINGSDPSRGVAGNLNAFEAAKLGKEIGARLVIPHHYNMFRFNTADPEEFVREATAILQPYRVLQLGERLTYS
jgi:L-ascorbate metabolism protein UlaG (beta-lactamase superfamily)